MKKSTLATVQKTALSNLTLQGNIDLNDVLSIVVSQAETKYNGELTRCRDELNVLEASRSKTRTKIQATIKEEVTAAFGSKKTELEAVLKPLGGVVKLDIYDTFSKENEIRGDLQVNQGKNSYGVSFTVTTKPSSHLLSLVEEVNELDVKITASQTEALKWKRQLQNMPVLERQYRAKLATKKLETVDGGQELLNLLTQDLEMDILKLTA